MGERFLDTEEVTCSIHVPPTIKNPYSTRLFDGEVALYLDLTGQTLETGDFGTEAADAIILPVPTPRRRA